MTDADVDPESIAARVADGQHVDWEDALRSASDDDERRLIRDLRLVEGVAQAHRSAGSEWESSSLPDMTGTVDLPKLPGAGGGGTTWGHLELREKLGAGAFGEVHRAWDSQLDREVALKLLHAEGPREKDGASKVVQEGRLLARLRHPNVVAVYGAEVREGRVGLWMELIRGRSLEQLLRDQGPFGAREAALIGIDLCRALAAVHGAGVVHRDVKAENVMREEGGRILLTDFGAGVDAGAGMGWKERSITGTPLYMAPELVRGESATQRSDIYGLGVLLFHLVTGSFPVEAATWSELRDKHARGEGKLLRDQRPDLPEAFVKVVERAIASHPEERFATAGRMEQALSIGLGAESDGAPLRDADFTLAKGGRSGRRTALLVGAAGLAAVLVVAGLMVAPTLMRNSGSVPTAGDSKQNSTGRVEPGHEPGAPVAWPAQSSREPAIGEYTVEAALYRVPTNSGQRERLEPGAHLSLGDCLTLDFKASAPLHVYVIDEDEAGHAYALFPLPGLDQQNPLPPAATHVLPGSRGGKDLSWTVDSPGGREHLMVLASPTRLIEFEAEMNVLARPGQNAVSIPETAKVRLRGIGGLAETPALKGGKSAGSLFEMAQRLASSSEVVKGVWMRQIDLENTRSR